MGLSAGEAFVVGDHASEASEQREWSGVGSVAGHCVVLIDRAGGGDDRVGGGVEDDGLGVAAEFVVELLSVDHIALITQVQCVLEDPPGGVRDPGLSRCAVGDQLAGAAQQVRRAGLVAGVGKPAVRRPSIALQHPRGEFSPRICAACS